MSQPDTKIDVLFVLDDRSSAALAQQKLAAQIPTFVNVLKGVPVALDLHVAVTTTDMGAPSDVPSQIACTTAGDAGKFRTTGPGTCTSPTIAAGASYLADDGRGTTNFTGSLTDALSCLSSVGSSGCTFGQPLAAAVHALGADNLQAGTPTPPSMNAGFLRSDASLAIILLTNQDDDSAPATSEAFSLDGGPDNITNPLGPLTAYRGDHLGHLCQDPSNGNAVISPPLTPPADAQGTEAAPTLGLVNCKDNDTSSGMLTPVSTLVGEIDALKTDPDTQILIGVITAPEAPYTVAWVPASGGQDTQAGELWPEILHSCGPKGSADVNPNPSTQFTADGSFGDPGVRLTQFVDAFPDSVLASICDPDYSTSMTAIATKIGQLAGSQNCITSTIQQTSNGDPSCTVTAQVPDGSTTSTVTYPYCADTANVPPCWQLTPQSNCNGSTFSWLENTPSSSITLTCSVCSPTAFLVAPGCPFPPYP